MPKTENYLVPLKHIAPFIKWLEHNSHEIDTIDDETLRTVWLEYCQINFQEGEE